MEGLARVDVLVNNAAIFWDGAFDAITDDDFRKMYEVNVIGAFVMAQEAAKRMDARRPHHQHRLARLSRRLCACALHHVQGRRGGADRAMAIDLAARGIFVNAVAPGLIETDMFRSLTPERQQELIAKQPTQEVGQPEDIANGIAFFASPRTTQRDRADPDPRRRPLDGHFSLLRSDVSKNPAMQKHWLRPARVRGSGEGGTSATQ